jgi:hypothetical protein
VNATGQMSLYKNVVSKNFTGSCTRVAGVPTLNLSDQDNDFFGTVAVAVVLAADEGSVTSVKANLGEDSEGITRRLVYQDAPKAKGTSAKLVAGGGTDFMVTGTALVYEDASKSGSLIPFSVSVVCAGVNW